MGCSTASCYCNTKDKMLWLWSTPYFAVGWSWFKALSVAYLDEFHDDNTCSCLDFCIVACTYMGVELVTDKHALRNCDQIPANVHPHPHDCSCHSQFFPHSCAAPLLQKSDAVHGRSCHHPFQICQQNPDPHIQNLLSLEPQTSFVLETVLQVLHQDWMAWSTPYAVMSCLVNRSFDQCLSVPRPLLQLATMHLPACEDVIACNILSHFTKLPIASWQNQRIANKIDTVIPLSSSSCFGMVLQGCEADQILEGHDGPWLKGLQSLLHELHALWSLWFCIP